MLSVQTVIDKFLILFQILYKFFTLARWLFLDEALLLRCQILRFLELFLQSIKHRISVRLVTSSKYHHLIALLRLL